MHGKRFIGFMIATIVTAGLACGVPDRPNVLFLAVDDLRPDLGAYGVGHARTPAMDRLAAGGRIFTRHYTQVPTCGASRRALMSGLYPRAAVDLGNNAILADAGGWAKSSLPAVFRAGGYRTIALGKVTHHPGGKSGKNWASGPEELPGAWHEHRVDAGPWLNPRAFMHGYANGKPRKPGQSPAIESTPGPDEMYPDAWTAKAACATLESLAKQDQPWFLAVGIIKPHLPFAVPASWHTLHGQSEIPAPTAAAKPSWPSGWHASGEMMKTYTHEGLDPRENPARALELRRAYAACVSYADAQIGRVLAALESSGLADRTIVVLWGDHGFHLGEHAIWGKHCLFEESLRSPLIVRLPDGKAPGEKSAATVETVDIFPTLADLCGLPVPEGLDGRSLRPWLEDPARPSAKPALGFWTGGQRAVRDDRWRLIEHGGHGKLNPLELYDLANDPHATREVSALHPDEAARLRGSLPPPVKSGSPAP